MKIGEMIDVLEAYRDGKEIEGRRFNNDVWEKCDLPAWCFSEFNYRIKPEPENPKTRLIRVEELPMPCFVSGCVVDAPTRLLVSGYCDGDQTIRAGGKWVKVPEFYKFSPDGKDWYKFEVNADTGEWIKS